MPRIAWLSAVVLLVAVVLVVAAMAKYALAPDLGISFALGGLLP